MEFDGLYDPSTTRDACGLGFVARIDGSPTREIVDDGLSILANLNHRGATGADPDTGDGAGLLVKTPHAFLSRVARENGFVLPELGWYAAGICFSWNDEDEEKRCHDLFSMIVAEEGQRLIGWRDVPVDLAAAGTFARSVAPRIRQVFIERRTEDRQAFERKLYLIRRRLHRTIEHAYGPNRFYVVSLSSHTLIYKGLLQGSQVGGFYLDLREPDFISALALVHSRFSTNTAESWALAHPYRYIAHNGEINTVRGNLNWMRARQEQLESELFGSDIPKLHPIIDQDVSDSAAFDNALEFLHMGGRSLPQAIMTMIPEAWESDHVMDAKRRAFYHYSGALMQPWDGPAAIAFTNGRIIGAVLDRNGLRPARYSITKDGRIVLASEDGALPIDASEIVERHKLGPGKMLVVDLEKNKVLHDSEIKAEVVASYPYREWVFDNAAGLSDPPAGVALDKSEPTELTLRQRAFGYTHEDVHLLIEPMAREGKEADGSMGTDTPLAVLSDRPHLLFDYAHQMFAQVTNPPIDPLRERSVMSLRVSLGRQHNLLIDGEHHARRVILPSPVLPNEDLTRVQSLTDADFAASTLSLLWPSDQGPEAMRSALDRLRNEAEEAIRSGSTILVLSDRGVDANNASIPSLLATGAVRHHLVVVGLGGSAAIVVETGEAREVHHFAALIAFGADAINPYLALETAAQLATEGYVSTGNAVQAQHNYVKAINKGLLKVISKFGISTIHSYHGSQLFEFVGISDEVIMDCFKGATSRLGGLGFTDIANETLARHHQGFYGDGNDTPHTLDSGSEYKARVDGKLHQWNERTIPQLQRAVRSGDYETYEEFAALADDTSQGPKTLRDLLELDLSKASVPLETVESAVEIVKRFNTGAMSLGSISRESHESMAIAMNRMSGKSNSGEGGEDSARFTRDEQGNLRRSAVKQIASGRFGVTAHYLVNADVLQIKVAQGAKPGEGGQLPGHKVSDEIARLRHSTPGVGLISPPPHHDIYSIEDLKQLIFDLKMVNPTADISVKLVAEAGVGTVAAGVAKAKADHITISGFDGGTGAAALSSIKHAGLPWEMGIAETQQALVHNGLRGKVRLQVDGQLKTGRDVVIGALLGAEEFGFSTAPLVAMGCVMMRVCHLNTCPVGIATQDPSLRKKFTGEPEHVINYFFFVAEQVRKFMAQLGFRTFDEMVGRVDKLKRSGAETIALKATTLDLNPILKNVSRTGTSARKSESQRHSLESSFDRRLWTEVEDAIKTGDRITVQKQVSNLDLTIGAYLSGEIAKRHGPEGLAKESVKLRLKGTPGQSFAVWGAKGLLFDLEGTTNDYTGKGLSGATIAVHPPDDAGYIAENAIITGNVALYGATSGEAYFNGIAGERFAVRNSGAKAVVEGCGEHSCEYMTGGVVVVLGPTGRNFAAGMSGGVAYIHQPDNNFFTRCNLDMVSLVSLDNDDEKELLRLLRRHVDLTGSSVATRLLDSWKSSFNQFVKVMPHDLERVLERNKPQRLEEAV